MQRTTLRSRLRTALLSMSAGAVVLACGAFITFDHVSFRRATQERLESIATLLGGSSAVAISFDHEKLAGEILQTLSSQPQILSAAIYDKNGAVFSRYVRSGAAGDLVPPSAAAPGPWSAEGHVGLWQRILYSNEPIGTIYLRSDLQDAWHRLKLNIATVALILGCILLATFVFTGRVVKGITGPVAALAETVRTVTSRRDYSLRAQKAGPAELEILIDGMNDMLSQIQVRDGALQLARSELETRVEERTAELRFLNDELSGEIKERRRIENSLRDKEQTMRTLVDYAPDAIVMLDVGTGKFVDANQNAERLYGHDRAKLLTLGPLDLSPALQPNGHRSSELVFEKIQEAVAGGLPSFEWVHLHSDGHRIQCEIHLVRLPVADRTLLRGSIMDISRRKEMDRLKDEFVSTVSHELRTPITSIQGSLGLIANGVLGALPPAAKPLVDIAYKNCQRLVLLINDILDSEKIAAGKMQFDFKKQPLRPLVEHAVESNRAYAAQFGVTYELAAGAEGAQAEVDADRLIQVLTNLLSNAAKFSPRGGVVTISIARREGMKLRISVADRGPGIPEEFRSRIFQKFSQADSSDTRLKGGTGLGLNISRAIAEKHNGTLFFETETGKGSTFCVELPEAPGAALPAAVPAGQAREARILVCDDDLQFGQYVQAALAPEGCRVEVCQSGVRALDLLHSDRFELLILDLLLPDRDGISVLRELRSRASGAELPVILCSGQASTLDRVSQSELRCSGVLSKPVDAAALAAAVRNALAPGAVRKSRVLHVESDAETRRLVARTLGAAAHTLEAASLAQARVLLQQEAVDLVILNVELPDGSGLELMPLLNRPGLPRIPAVAFNGARGTAGGIQSLAGSFLEALSAHNDLPAPIRALAADPGGRLAEGALR